MQHEEDKSNDIKKILELTEQLAECKNISAAHSTTIEKVCNIVAPRSYCKILEGAREVEKNDNHIKFYGCI